MTIHDERIIELLTKHGWSPFRRVDTSPWERELSHVGFHFNPAWHDVMSSLGGLVIYLPDIDEPGAEYLRAHFDPTPLKDALPPLRWDRQLKNTLAPIGEGWGDAILYIDNEGRIYYEWDMLFERLGDNLESSLKALFFNEGISS